VQHVLTKNSLSSRIVSASASNPANSSQSKRVNGRPGGFGHALFKYVRRFSGGLPSNGGSPKGHSVRRIDAVRPRRLSVRARRTTPSSMATGRYRIRATESTFHTRPEHRLSGSQNRTRAPTANATAKADTTTHRPDDVRAADDESGM